MRESYIRVKNVLPGKHGSPSAEKNQAIADTVGQKMKQVKAVLIPSINHPANTPFEIGAVISNWFQSGKTGKHLVQV